MVCRSARQVALLQLLLAFSGVNAAVGRGASTAADGSASQCSLRREDDLKKPLRDVLLDSDRPDDGFCHFGFLEPSIQQCALARKAKNYKQYASWAALGRNASEFDKAFCRESGYLDLPQEKVDNFLQWSEMSDWECEKLVGDRGVDATVRVLLRLKNKEEKHFNSKAPGKATMRLTQRSAMMCGLGGVGCDMAHCATNFCRLEGGKIGHGKQCLA